MSEQSTVAEVSQNAVVPDTDLVVFRESRIHGMGAYARVPIAKGTDIIEYTGEKIDKQEAARRCEAENPFIFALDDEHDIDGSVPWNPARYLNHSCEANCEAIDYEGEIWITAVRDIEEGEELTYNYNYDLEEYRNHPCRCGAPSCVGYMVSEQYFDHVRRQQELAREAGTLTL